jgi:hypothetical protein
LLTLTTYINTEDEFQRIASIIERTFDLDCMLPDQVFRKEYGHFLFTDFDWSMTSDIWPTLAALAMKAKDDQVLLYVAEPPPRDDVLQLFGHYDCMSIPVESSAEEYGKSLWYEPSRNIGDAIAIFADNVVWTSPSVQWAIWGWRTSETCILATKDSFFLDQSILSLNPWKPIEEYIQNISTTYSNIMGILKNYGTTG